MSGMAGGLRLMTGGQQGTSILPQGIDGRQVEREW
jgi:hypothetical protein